MIAYSDMVAINVKVEKQDSENNTSLLRRFTKRVQASGILPRVKSIRFNSRQASDLKKKRQTLKRIERIKEREKLIKLGKIPERSSSFRRR